MSSSPLQGFSLPQWYITWGRLLNGGKDQPHPSKSCQLPPLWGAIWRQLRSLFCCSNSFPFYFISFPRFPTKYGERQCYSYWFLFADLNDTTPSSGDSVLESLIKCHSLQAYGLSSFPGSSNWQQGSSSTPWREIFLKSENAILPSHDKNHWSAYVQLYIAFPYSSHPICNPLLAIMLQ